MPGPDLLSLIGVAIPTSPNPDPQAVLESLFNGLHDLRVCGLPSTPSAGTWLRVSALPAADPQKPGPFTSLFAGLSGGVAELWLLLHHSAAGIQLFASAGSVLGRERLRLMLAPACDVVAGDPPPMIRPLILGVRYRLQPDLATETSRPALSAGLIQQLGTITDEWSVLLKLQPVFQSEIQETQQCVNRLGEVASDNLSVTRQAAATRSVNTVSAGWARVQQWLTVLHGQLTQGGGTGLWKTSVWVSGKDEWTVDQVLASMRGAIIESDRRRFMAIEAQEVHHGAVGPISVLTSGEVAGMFEAPTASVPGLLVRPAPPSSRRPDTSGEAIRLGSYWSTSLPAVIAVSDLEGHAFVTGTTGSGKTTTLHRLLAEAWNVHSVPFLVLDPVKDEYSGVANLFRGGLNVVTGRELCMNVMQAWPGEDVQQHVMQVAQAFRGSFTMPSPTPYVVTQLFDVVAMQPGGPEGTELFDLRDSLDPLVLGLGYAPEAQSNIRASIMTRLNILLAPLRAHRFAWPDSHMVAELFTRPSVVTLADLVDDEERSFLVLLLALATWAEARNRRHPRAVEHLLVLEEAHRVMPEVGQTSLDQEAGSAKMASAEILSSMLAEVRGYGEQVIVVDQSPSKVSADVLRNTNLKIVHRVVAPLDQQEVAGAIGLEPAQSGLLGSLARGQAIISSRHEPAPQTIAVEKAVPIDPQARVQQIQRQPADWPCCDAGSPEIHFRAWGSGPKAEVPMALFVAGCRVGGGDGDGRALRARVVDLLQPLAQSAGSRVRCMAWAGLRRILVIERGLGLLPNARALEAAHGALFELFDTGAPASLQSASDFGVPGIGIKRTCPECGTICNLRVPAWSYVAASPRTGLFSLAGPNWRADLGEVSQWVKTARGELEPMLGDAGATTMVRCQVNQAVRRYRLGPEVIEMLLKRSGTPAE